MFDKKEQAPGHDAPDLIIQHTARSHHRTHRFFFREHLPHDEHISRIKPRLEAIPGVFPDGGVRHHPHYIAVQWSERLACDAEDDVIRRIPQLIENTAIEILSSLFGWQRPRLERIESHALILSKGRHYGVDWDLGS